MDVSNNEFGKPTVYLDSEDICYNCTNKYGCPLIEALNQDMISLKEDELIVKECEHFDI